MKSSSISDLCDSAASSGFGTPTSAEEIMTVLIHTSPSATAVRQLCGRAGLGAVTSALRPYMDDTNPDEIKDFASNALAVLASALGIPALLPFFESLCQSTATAREGIRAVEKIAALVGPNEVAPHLKPLVDLVHPGLHHRQDERVRVAAARSLARLAQSAIPAADSVTFNASIVPLYVNMMCHRGELRAYSATALRAMFPLMMDPIVAHDLTLEVLDLTAELLVKSPLDPEMERVALDSIKHCMGRRQVFHHQRHEQRRFFLGIVKSVFKRMWTSMVEHHPMNYQRLVEATAELVNVFDLDSFTVSIPEMLPGESQDYITTVIRTVEKASAWGFDRDAHPHLLEELIHDIQILFSSIRKNKILFSS